MKREAVLHIPMSRFAHSVGERRVVIRLRAAKDDLRECRLFYADRACREDPVTLTKVDMPRVACDELFDFFEVELQSPYSRICYYFELYDGVETLLYYDDCFHTGSATARMHYYQLPYIHRADCVDIPDWAYDAVVCNIFPDSFATSRRSISGQPTEAKCGELTTHGRLGGTISGIRENIDYLRELGFNCIYLNPIFAAGHYHKYDIIDYYRVDPCFGTNEDLRELVKVCHQNGMRVILDGVFNHCSWEFFAFEDVVQKGAESEYLNWFYDVRLPVVRPDNPEDIPGYECFAYERLMPKLATDNPAVEAYFCDVGKYWLREYDIDGWRLDVANEINDGFWRAFRAAVRSVKPDCLLIGEVWETAAHWLNGDMFDSSMNYNMRRYCQDFFADGVLSAEQFDWRVTDMLMRYRANIAFGQLNLLDSHDVSRFLTICGGNEAIYKLAVLFQIGFTGIPSVFYGDEMGITGAAESEYRAPMRWSGESGLYDFFRQALALRSSQPALCRGNYRMITAQSDGGLYIFSRSYKGQSVLFALNRSDKAADPGDALSGEPIMTDGVSTATSIAPFGYYVVTK